MPTINIRQKLDRNTIIAISILGFIIILAIIGIVIGNTSNEIVDNTDLSQHDDIAELTEPFAYFQNSTYLQSYLDNSISNGVLNNLDTILTSESELAAAPDANSPINNLPDNAYVITIDNANLITDVYFPYSTYKFQIKISDGRTYLINLAVNGSMYYGLIVERITPRATSAPYFYINILEMNDSSQYNRDQVISTLTNWAHSLGYRELLLTTTK